MPALVYFIMKSVSKKYSISLRLGCILFYLLVLWQTLCQASFPACNGGYTPTTCCMQTEVTTWPEGQYPQYIQGTWASANGSYGGCGFQCVTGSIGEGAASGHVWGVSFPGLSGVISGQVNYEAYEQQTEAAGCQYSRFASNTFSVLKDINPPDIAVVSPAANTIVKLEDNLKGTIADDYQFQSITAGSYNLDFIAAAGKQSFDPGGILYHPGLFKSGTWEVPVGAVAHCTGLLEEITIAGNDSVGNTGQTSHSIYVDCAQPEIKILIPQPGALWQNMEAPVINGTANDDIGIDAIWLTIKDDIANRYWDGTKWVAGNTLLYIPGVSGKKLTAWEYNSLNKDILRSGTYTIKAYVKDKVGRKAESETSSAYRNRYYLGKKDFTAFGINVKTVKNDGLGTVENSFTTLSSENSVFIEAQLLPVRVGPYLNDKVKWTIVGVNSASGHPSAWWGNPSSFLVANPEVPAYSYPNGRNTQMGYRVFARVEQESGAVGSADKGIDQDKIDKCRQEYMDFKVGTINGGSLFVPARSEFSYFGESSGGNFSFSNLSGGDYPFSIVKSSLFEGLEALRTAIRALPGSDSKELSITGGYRNPQHNADISPRGAHDSRHQWGDAADLLVLDLGNSGGIKDWKKMADLACDSAGASYVERYSQSPTHLHLDFGPVRGDSTNNYCIGGNP